MHPQPTTPAPSTTPPGPACSDADQLRGLDATLSDARGRQPSREKPAPLAATVAESLRDIPDSPEDPSRRLAALEAANRAQRDGRWAALSQRLGRRYAEARFGTFEVYDPKQRPIVDALRQYAEHLPDYACEGRGVLLYGPPGTGKDHLLVALCRAAVLHHGYRVEWINGLDWQGEIRDRMGRDEPEAKAIRALVGPDCLAISDPLPPWGGLTGFQAQMLFRVIDARYRDCKPTWLTMNVASKEEADERLGVAVVDRLQQQALLWFCCWGSYRSRAK